MNLASAAADEFASGYGNSANLATLPSLPLELQCVLLQSVQKQPQQLGDLPSALFNHVYNAYFAALLKHFSEYYSSLLQLQPDTEPAKLEPAPAACQLSPPSGTLSPVDTSVADGSAKPAQASSSTAYNDFQDGVTVGYTYDAFFVTDGRSRKRKQPTTTSATSGNVSVAANVQSAAVPAELPCEEHVQVKRQLRYVCNECGKNYATSSNLSRHKQTHRSLNSKSAKKCPHCDKVYVSMPALSMHILTHDLKHKCDVCGKAFSRLWLLNGHKRIHSKEKPYGCAHCGKAFADRSNLRAHIQTHSQFKLYKCDFCGKSFALKSYLNKHYESSACCAAALNGAVAQGAQLTDDEHADGDDTASACDSEALSMARSDSDDKRSGELCLDDDSSHDYPAL